MKYKYLEHTADIKFQAFGKTLEECFENSAYAMVNSMHKGKVKLSIKKKFKVNGKDLESLMYNFLEELLFLLETENFIWGRFKISIKSKNKGKDLELNAEVLGDDANKYELETHVKAITYNDMFVKFEEDKFNSRYVCQVVVDV